MLNVAEVAQQPAYEVSNPSVSDLSLEDQIRFGINNWCAEDSLGRPFYGRTQEEAEKIRADYSLPTC